jgi:hypothetical protein
MTMMLILTTNRGDPLHARRARVTKAVCALLCWVAPMKTMTMKNRKRAADFHAVLGTIPPTINKSVDRQEACVHRFWAVAAKMPMTLHFQA